MTRTARKKPPAPYYSLPNTPETVDMLTDTPELVWVPINALMQRFGISWATIQKAGAEGRIHAQGNLTASGFDNVHVRGDSAIELIMEHQRKKGLQ